MSLVSYFQSLGATHGFSFSNSGTNISDDFGDSPDPTQIITGTYSFAADPVAYGATHCLRTTSSGSTSIDGATLDNRNDINFANGAGNDSSTINYNTGTRSIVIWSRQPNIWNPTCIYEQGGGTNNFAFMGGGQTTFQAADAGQDFLIAAGRVVAQANRNKLLVGVWEHRNQHAGSANRVLYYENGVLQNITEEAGATQTFPNHSGDITIGNSGDSLQSFNATTFISQTVQKDTNWLVMLNNVSLMEAECREIFERSVLPEHLIIGTVAQQQAQLDALSGSTFQDVNCAIEIRQATDATDWSLNLDNITFVQNPNLGDIAIKFIGTGNLTVINGNGSNAEIVAAPIEQDLDGLGNILQGGGTITIEAVAPLEIQVLDDLGDAVSNAHVYIYKSGTTDVIFNGSADANGIVSLEYVGLTPQPIDGWARNYDLSGGDLRTEQFSGALQAVSGFSRTLILARE